MTEFDILDDLQYALMEPVDNGATWPSGLWTQAEVLARMNERQNRFLKHALLLVGISSPLPLAVGLSRVALPEDWLVTAQVYWAGDDGTVRELVRSDQFQADHAHPEWPITAEANPEVYFDNDAPLLQLSVAPAATQSGALTLHYVPQGDPFDATGTILPSVPDEFADAAIFFGALADLLNKDGRGRSPERAAYCEMQYQLGQEAASLILRSSWVG